MHAQTQIVRASLLASELDSQEQAAVAGRLGGVSKSPSAAQLLEDGQLEGSIRNRAAASLVLAPRFCLLDFRRAAATCHPHQRHFRSVWMPADPEI